MFARLLTSASLLLVCGVVTTGLAQEAPPRPYRLNAVDLKQRVIWGAECRLPDGTGLAFGGQDQQADDGRPHTRVLSEGEWLLIDRQLREQNPLQEYSTRIRTLRGQAKKLLARARTLYFQGLPVAQETTRRQRDVLPLLAKLRQDLAATIEALPAAESHADRQQDVQFAFRHLEHAREQLPAFDSAVTAASLNQLHQAQIHLELASESLAAEPPPRAMNCGTARLSSSTSGPAGNTLVYDSRTQLYVLSGGDHLDYLTNDTWVFDPAKRRWQLRHPAGAPPPRANHRLEAPGDGTIRLTGGFTYSSATDYLSGQYVDLADGPWVYDLTKNTWSGGKLVPPDTRVYRTGPFHPRYYLEGPEPDAAAFEAWLKQIPANQWVPTNPPHRPRLNRDWGTARLDPDHDIMLRWSGGHSAHGGTDVLHYHFSTNRWELPIPVEFPLGQLYSNTSYPNGFNFNLRPWMTGHTYQNYDYDPPTRTMIKAGRPNHYYIYDPDEGDWIGRGVKPRAMQYNSCFYTLTLTATPEGIVCWDRNGRVHRYAGPATGWKELKTTGDKLPGAYVDNSSICYDSRRNRVLMINTAGYGKPFDGRVWALDLKSREVTALTPAGREAATRFATIDKCCYDAEHDLLLLGTYLTDAGDHTPTPAYDCRTNRWITLNLSYSTGKRSGRVTRQFPHARSDGLMFDSTRQLVWGTDTNSQVYVLRLEIEHAGVQPLTRP